MLLITDSGKKGLFKFILFCRLIMGLFIMKMGKFISLVGCGNLMLGLLLLCRNDTDLYTYSVLIYASFVLSGYCLNLVIAYIVEI